MAITKRRDAKGNKYGSYRISVYKGKDDAGRKQWHWETFDGNIQQARERETQIKYELSHGTYIPPGKKTLAQLLDVWLEDHVKPKMSPSTYRGWEQQVRNHVKPCLGKILLTALTPPMISAYYTDRQKAGLSQRTIIHHREMLHAAFQTAIEWGYLQHNPVEGTTRLKAARLDMQTYDMEEIAKYLATALKEEPEFHPYFLLVLHTGIRRSELLGLLWRDIDENYQAVSINRSYQAFHKERIVRETKTDKSRRLIPLTSAAAAVLKAHRKRTEAALKAQGIAINREMYVFCHLDTGLPYHPSAVSHAWSRIGRKAGLKHIRLHDARHTLATILLTEGVNPKIVQELLGHSEVSTTMDTYSHVIPSLKTTAIDKLDAAFKNSYNKTVGEHGLSPDKK